MKHLSKLALLAAAFFTGLSANAQSINANGGQSVTISSDQTCTSFDVLDGSTLTVNQGVTLTLNISNGYSFNFFDNSNLELHGTLAGSVGSGATWMDNTYINVYLSDGAKYTVTGLSCMDGDNYLRYYGYDAATDGNGTVSVMNGTTDVTASSIGYKTTTYTFTATPSSGYRFVSWTKGASGEVLGTDASIAVTCEQNGQYQVYANFEEDVPAVAQTETLLTTITATAQEQASYSTANVATVSFSYTSGGSSAYLANWGWWGYGWIATVTAAEGYTITKCIFYDDANRTATDSEAPFVVETTEADKTPKVNGTPILANTSKGIKKIEVYGYVTPAGPQMRTLTGVPQGWQVQAGDPLAVVDSNADGSYSIEAGQPVLLVPSAEDKPRVKSVTLVDNSTPAAVLIESITLNKTATTISAGNTETLSVTSVLPDNATDQTVTWSSDNEAVATVDADGKVTAVALGTANITATANDGSGVKATCAVTVSKVVTINQSDWGSGWNPSFTKDGVTVSASMIDPHDGNLMGGGTFSTTLGNFTKIVVTAAHCAASGTGWSGGSSSKTWAGTPASTVSFSGDFMGFGMTQTTIVCTIEPTN